MSIHVMNLVWRSRVEGANRRFMLLALADRADDDGYCWPGVQNLVEKTGLSVRTVDRTRKSLEADRLLLQEQRWTEQGGRDTNGYWINLQALEMMQRPRKSKRGPHPLATPEGDPVTVTGPSRHHDTTPPVTVTPNTSVESAGSPHEDHNLKRSADAPSPRAVTADDDPWLTTPSSDPLPPPSYRDEPDEWIDHKAGGLDSSERNLMDAMLNDGQEPKKILNKILKDRSGIAAGDRGAVRGDWLPYVRRKVGGWRGGERDYARKLLADYHPDIVVEELLCLREQRAA